MKIRHVQIIFPVKTVGFPHLVVSLPYPTYRVSGSYEGTRPQDTWRYQRKSGQESLNHRDRTRWAISPSRIDYSFIKKCRNWNVVKYQYL